LCGQLVSTQTTPATGAVTAKSFINDVMGNIVQSLTTNAAGVNTSLRRLTSSDHVYTTWAGDGAAASMPSRASMSFSAAPQSLAVTTPGATTTEATPPSGPRVQNFDESGNAIVQVQQGETLQSLALQAYGDSKYWYLIAEANGLASNSQITAC
jgi:nucleoid-associated protein YgaU